jgi:hypothetical protein
MNEEKTSMYVVTYKMIEIRSVIVEAETAEAAEEMFLSGAVWDSEFASSDTSLETDFPSSDMWDSLESVREVK